MAVKLLATAIFSLVAAARAGQLPWSWPGWEHLSTATWGANNSCCPGNGAWNTSHSRLHCCSGLDSRAEAEFKASTFDLIFLDNGIGTPGCNFSFNTPPGTDTMLDCHRHRSNGASIIRTAARRVGRPDVPIFTYRQISARLEGVDTDDPLLAPLWITADDAGNAVAPGRLDWRKPEASEWYVDNVLGAHTVDDPNFDGVFIDGPIASSQLCCAANYTLASRKALFLGVATMLKKATALLGARAKVLTASLGSHYSNLTEFYPEGYATGGAICPESMPLDSLEPCCAFGENKFYEVIGGYSKDDERMFVPFRQFNIPSRDFGDAAHGGNDTLGCAAAVVDAAMEMASRPAFITNNNGWPNATDGGIAINRHNVSLAAYLMGAAADSYFASGLHWSDLIPGTNLKAWPAWSDYGCALGPPRGPYMRSGFVFRRRFEHATVSIDCGTISADIEWAERSCESGMDFSRRLV